MDWNTYFLNLAISVAKKSKDPHTKCGCVLANSLNEIVSTGFNNPPRLVHDDLIPWNRPDPMNPEDPHKYQFVIHSELAAILSAQSHLTECSAFVSGKPCFSCTQLLYHVGIRKIVYTDWSKPSSAHYPTKSFDIFFRAIKESLDLIFIPSEQL